MATREQLEQRASFRFVKIAFWIAITAVFAFTLLSWYSVRELVIDASDAHALCNHAPDKSIHIN